MKPHAILPKRNLLRSRGVIVRRSRCCSRTLNAYYGLIAAPSWDRAEHSSSSRWRLSRKPEASRQASGSSSAIHLRRTTCLTTAFIVLAQGFQGVSTRPSKLTSATNSANSGRPRDLATGGPGIVRNKEGVDNITSECKPRNARDGCRHDHLVTQK